MQQIPMRGGLERSAFDTEPKGYIRLKPGVRKDAKHRYSKRARKVAKLETKKGSE